MRRWKALDGGGFEFFPTKDELLLRDTAKTTDQLTAENEDLKEKLSGVLSLLMEKNLITKEDAEKLSPESNEKSE